MTTKQPILPMLSRSNTEKSWVPAESEIETSAGNPQSAVPVMHKLPLPDWLRRGTSLKRESDDSSDELHVVVTGIKATASVEAGQEVYSVAMQVILMCTRQSLHFITEENKITLMMSQSPLSMVSDHAR